MSRYSEMHLCHTIDQLAVALDAARSTVDTMAFNGANASATEIPQLVAAIRRLDTTGEAVIAAVKAVLAL